MKNIELTGLGNGLVDILVNVEDSFLEKYSLEKGTMRLVDAEEQDKYLNELENKYLEIKPAGSVCNSVAAFANMGGKSACLTGLGDDDFGNIYRDEMANLNIRISEMSTVVGKATGTSLIMITPDAERTMRTCLAATGDLSAEHIDEAIVKDSQRLFIEGYVIANPEHGQGAIRRTIELAKQHNTELVLTISEPFIVDIFGEFLREIVPQVDILFANEFEAQAYTGLDNPSEAAKALGEVVPHSIVTAGADGAYISCNHEFFHIPAVPCNPVDLTGAGDMFAAGYLYGITKDLSIEKSAQLAVLLASKVISVVGPRLENINELLDAESFSL